MEDKIRRIYVPMTESGFYILYCLQTPQHAYGISKKKKKMTVIRFYSEEEKRKLYLITQLGQEILGIETRRIERLYKNSKGEYVDA